MPYLKEQVKIINEHIQKNGIGGARFSGASFKGLAKLIHQEGREGEADSKYPVVHEDMNDPVAVVIDDTFPLLVYHRHLRSAFEDVKASFGSTSNVQEERAEMVMVVYGKRQTLKVTEEELSTLFILAMPNSVSKTALAGIKIDVMEVAARSSSTDPLSVFGEEYQNVKYRLGPDDILFKISYSILSRYRKDCFNLCDCEKQ